MESLNPLQKALGKVANYGSKKLTTANLTVSTYTSPITKFVEFFSGKYTGAVFSIIIILLFSLLFRNIVRSEDTTATSKSKFLVNSVKTWFSLLIILIILHILR